MTRAGSEELLTSSSRNKSVLLQNYQVGKSADELCPNRHLRFNNKTPSPILTHVRSQGSVVAHNLIKSSAASPPPSPLSTPNITSLRQSKTLNQLNRFISPPNSMLGSPVLDIIGGDKENRLLNRHCIGPLQLLNFKRPGKWRPPSYPQMNSPSVASGAGGGSGFFGNSSLATTNNNLVVAAAAAATTTTAAEPRKTSSRYRLGLYRLLKHTPHPAHSSTNESENGGGRCNSGGVSKRWDINRNGFAGSGNHSTTIGNNRANSYGVAPYRVASTPNSSPSHSKCCSLC